MDLSSLTEKELLAIKEYENFLDSWKDRCLLKFTKGKIEHRGEGEPDNMKELEFEIMDATAYLYLIRKNEDRR